MGHKAFYKFKALNSGLTSIGKSSSVQDIILKNTG